MENKNSILKIIYNDGPTLSYEISKDKADAFNLASKIDALMASNCISLEIDGKLFMIPTTSIRSIEFNPAPEELPPSVISGLTPIL